MRINVFTVHASHASRCSPSARVYVFWTGGQLCAYVRMWTMPPVADRVEAPWSSASLRGGGRDWPWYNGGCEGGGKHRRRRRWWRRRWRRWRGKEGVVSRDKARQMGQTMRHRHPPCMSTTPPGLLTTSACPFISPHVPEFLHIPAFVQLSARFAPFYHLRVDSNSTGLFLCDEIYACSGFWFFFAAGTFCFCSPNNLKFLSSFCLLLRFLIVPSSDKKSARCSCGGERDHIASTDGHSCHLLCRNPLVWKADPISRFSGFPANSLSCRRARGAFCLLPSVSHPSLTAPRSQREGRLSPAYSPFGASAALNTSLRDRFHLDICTNVDGSCQQTSYVKTNKGIHTHFLLKPRRIMLLWVT